MQLASLLLQEGFQRLYGWVLGVPRDYEGCPEKKQSLGGLRGWEPRLVLEVSSEAKAKRLQVWPGSLEEATSGQ